MSMQLTLGIRLREETTLTNFYVGANQQLVTQLHQFSIGQGEKFIYLYGISGSGRTHLLQACCHHANQCGRRAAYLSLANTALIPTILENWEKLDLVCIDDIEAISSNSVWQQALFHFYNRIQSTTTYLLIAGNASPRELKFDLKDLLSRLSAGVIFQIKPLTDEEKIAVLQMRAHARGFNLSTEVAQYLLNHCPRNTHALFATLEKLDQASLEAKHKLTIPFVKSVLLF